MKALLDGFSHVTAEAACASAGADGLTELPGQRDADLFDLAVQAGPGSVIFVGADGWQRSHDTLQHLLAGVGLQRSSHRLFEGAKRRSGFVIVIVTRGSSHEKMLPLVATSL